MRCPFTLSRLPRHKKTYIMTLAFALDFTECVVSLAFEPGSAASGHQELQQTAGQLSNGALRHWFSLCKQGREA